MAVPEDRKQLQRFLGFANFYRRFIRDFNCVVAPLTLQTSPALKFLWSQGADAAFSKLKRLFTSVPLLVYPDPSQQFVVEVDASDTGVGATHGPENNLHPCAFFSPAERNYDVGNLPSSLGRFNFTLTYHPGSHKVKPDALSRQFSPLETTSTPGHIVPD